jgi:hypothetical protein
VLQLRLVAGARCFSLAFRFRSFPARRLPGHSLPREFCGRQSEVNGLESKACLFLSKTLRLCLGLYASDLLGRHNLSLLGSAEFCFFVCSLPEFLLFTTPRRRFSPQPGFTLDPQLNFLLRLVTRGCRFD